MSAEQSNFLNISFASYIPLLSNKATAAAFSASNSYIYIYNSTSIHKKIKFLLAKALLPNNFINKGSILTPIPNRAKRPVDAEICLATSMLEEVMLACYI